MRPVKQTAWVHKTTWCGMRVHGKKMQKNKNEEKLLQNKMVGVCLAGWKCNVGKVKV
jgi:hypothetical protein